MPPPKRSAGLVQSSRRSGTHFFPWNRSLSHLPVHSPRVYACITLRPGPPRGAAQRPPKLAPRWKLSGARAAPQEQVRQGPAQEHALPARPPRGLLRLLRLLRSRLAAAAAGLQGQCSALGVAFSNSAHHKGLPRGFAGGPRAEQLPAAGPPAAMAGGPVWREPARSCREERGLAGRLRPMSSRTRGPGRRCRRCSPLAMAGRAGASAPEPAGLASPQLPHQPSRRSRSCRRSQAWRGRACEDGPAAAADLGEDGPPTATGLGWSAAAGQALRSTPPLKATPPAPVNDLLSGAAVGPRRA